MASAGMVALLVGVVGLVAARSPVVKPGHPAAANAAPASPQRLRVAARAAGSASQSATLIDAPNPTGTLNGPGGVTAGLDTASLRLDLGAAGGPKLSTDITAGIEPGAAVDGVVGPLVKGVSGGSSELALNLPRIRGLTPPIKAGVSASGQVGVAVSGGATWTNYADMNDCKADTRNTACFGLRDGQAIGLIDPFAADNHLDQMNGVPYDDENVLPPPEGPSNPVVEVWNNTPDYVFIASGTSFAADAKAGVPIYYAPPDADLRGPPLDADVGWASARPAPVDAGTHDALMNGLTDARCFGTIPGLRAGHPCSLQLPPAAGGP